MTAAYEQEGEIWDHTPGSNVTSGDVVIMGGTIGVAVNDIASGETGAVAVRGVFTLPKVTAAVIAQGEGLIWDVSAGKFEDDQATPATGDVSNAATAVAAATSSDTTVLVTLNVSTGVVA